MAQSGGLTLDFVLGGKIEYQLCWGKGGNVTSAGWQATLCDPIWNVSSRTGVATLLTAIHLLLYLLNFAMHSEVLIMMNTPVGNFACTGS